MCTGNAKDITEAADGLSIDADASKGQASDIALLHGADPFVLQLPISCARAESQFGRGQNLASH